MKINVYFAGPLFTHAEITWNKLLAESIEKVNPNIELFLPQIKTAAALKCLPPDFKRVQQICLDGIDESDTVIAVLDGADADSGTCFECGYAYAKGIPVIGIRTDERSGEDKGMNAMLTQSCKQIVRLDLVKGRTDELAALAVKIVEAVRTVITSTTSAPNKSLERP
ncbi:MAG: nucleoside 2-deoxyribosyltransferase [Deltaproteobacteria bacterium]|nr:nucleoside 2-deoxyribosyltransferase [Deltaproteobacteria bacterium]